MKSLNIFSILLITVFGYFSCGPDNKVSAEYSEHRVLKNISSYNLKLKLFHSFDSLIRTISVNDSIILSADCKVRGGDKTCFNSDYRYEFATSNEDSIYIIFNNEKILRYRREEIGTCCIRNILKREEQWGYNVSGEGTSRRTYTYDITNEDYENAEDCNGHPRCD